MLRKTGIALAISLAFPAASFALGLGAMQTSSQLSQPFSARIELLGASASELDDIAVRLADASQFQRAGLVLTAQLLALRFEVINDPKGDYIKVSTRGPVNEPVLDFIVELRSPSGTILREYAVLLDPPSYAMRSAQQPRPAAPAPKAAVSAAAPATPMPVPIPTPPARPTAPVAQATPTPPASPPPQPQQAAPVARPAKAALAPVAPPPASPAKLKAPTPAPVVRPVAPVAKAQPPPPPEPLAEGEVAPKSNETLWEIAKRYRPDPSVSVPQMMIAIQRANPEAFPDNNVRNLRPGATLAIPDEESIASVSEAEADAEVQRQVARWRERRLAIASRPAPQAKPVAAPTPQPEGKPASQAPLTQAGAAADARLEIVAPGSKSSPKGAAEAALRDEHAAALASEMAELRARLDEAAGIIDLLENQVKLKNEELSRIKQATPAAGGTGATGASAAAGAGSSASPVEPAAVTLPGTPPSAPRPAAPAGDDVIPAPPEAAPLLPPEFVESVPGGWLSLGGLLAALLAGIGLVVRRRRSKPESPPAEPESPPKEPSQGWRPRLAGLLSGAVESWRSRTRRVDAEAPVVSIVAAAPAPTAVALAAPALAPLPPEVDPLEEVNIYLAYERFDQAEELVRKVIGEHPENPDYRLRLLEVLQAAAKPADFERAARGLREMVEEDDPRWDEACSLWREFDSGRELLATPAGGQAIAAVTAQEVAPAPSTSALEEALESTQTGLMQTDEEFGLKAEEALDELDALLGRGGEAAGGARDVLELGNPTDEQRFAPPQTQRQAAPTAPSREPQARRVAAEEITSTELDFDLGGLDLGATGEVDLEVVSRAKVAEASLDLELDAAPDPMPVAAAGAASDLTATLPPAGQVAALAEDAAALDLDLDLDFGAVEDLVAEQVVPAESSRRTDAEGQAPGSSPSPQPVAATVITGTEEFDLSLEGDLAASLDLAAELGLNKPQAPALRVEATPEPEFAPLPPSVSEADLDLSLDIELEMAPTLQAPASPVVAHGFDLELDAVEEDIAPDALLESSPANVPTAEPGPDDELSFALDDETDTKLNLAKAYIELGETEAARSILGEVISEGEPGQRAEAQRLLSQIG